MVTIVNTVSTELGLLNVTTNTAGEPSVGDGLFIVTVGAGSLSMIVPIAVAVGLLVPVELPVIVNVSFGSSIASSVVGTVTVAVVCPAGIVMVCVVDV